MPSPVAITGQYVNSSSYASLSLADAAAVGLGVGLNIDADWTLAANTTLNANPVAFTNGIVTLGSFSLRINGQLIAGDRQHLFVATGSGTVTPAATSNISVYWFGAVGDGVHDDTNASQQAVNAAQAAASALSSTAGVAVGASVCWNNGCFLWTGTVTGSYEYMNYIGSGKGSSLIIFRPAPAGPSVVSALVLDAGAGNQVNFCRISGLSFWSDDTTHTKTAIDLIDVSVCEVSDIHIFGSQSGIYWHGGTGSIGIRTAGRDQTSVHDIYVAADLPVYVDENPHATRDQNEDMDHWHWWNLYLLPLGNYAFTVKDGIGLDATVIDGYQAWVGGTGGFVMNDNRTGSFLPTRDLRIANVRTEQQTDPNGYAIKIGSVANAVVNVSLENCTLGSATQGLSLGVIQHITLDNITAATPAGKTCISVGTPFGINSLAMRNCTWQPGSTFSLPGYVSSQVTAFNTLYFAGPSDATYVAAPGVNLDFRYSAQEQNDVKTLKWKCTLATGASQLLAANIVGQGVTSILARASGTSASAVEGGMVGGPNGAPALAKLSGSANFAATDSAGNLCVYVDGSSHFWVKNNTANTLAVVVIAEASF